MPSSITIEQSIATIVHTHAQLSVLNSFVPSARVNALFQTLVSTIQQNATFEDHIMNQANILQVQPTLRTIAAIGEYEMEVYWSKYISTAATPEEAWNRLHSFWYADNYVSLVAHEYMVASTNIEQLKKDIPVLFVGGGPLPLTAIYLYTHYGLPCIILDSSDEACHAARQVVSALGLTKHIRIIHCAGEEYTEYSDAQLIIVAALAGSSDNEKQTLYTHIGSSISDDGVVLIRAATGIRTLLYAGINIETVPTLTQLYISDPKKELINCVHVCKKYTSQG